LKVVRIAAVFWDSFSLSATFCLNLDIFTLSVNFSATTGVELSTTEFEIEDKASPLVILPSLPVLLICLNAYVLLLKQLFVVAPDFALSRVSDQWRRRGVA
jgi:hypothetical protein